MLKIQNKEKKTNYMHKMKMISLKDGFQQIFGIFLLSERQTAQEVSAGMIKISLIFSVRTH